MSERDDSSYRTKPVSTAFMVQEFAREHEPPRRHVPPRAYSAQPERQPRTAQDAAEVLGLTGDLVDDVLLEALGPAMDEIDRLRALEEQAEHRLAWVERQSDRHSLLPCLNRRAFIRELENFLMGGDAFGAVGLVHVAGVEELSGLYGLAAGDGGLRHACAKLMGGLRPTDVVGCLGGSDFVFLLPGTTQAAAEKTLSRMVAQLTIFPYLWAGQPMTLHPSLGVYALGAGDNAELALAGADVARRRNAGVA